MNQNRLGKVGKVGTDSMTGTEAAGGGAGGAGRVGRVQHIHRKKVMHNSWEACRYNPILCLSEVIPFVLLIMRALRLESDA